MNKQELIEKIKKAIKDELSGNYYREFDNYGRTEYEHYTEEDAQSVANDIILDLEEDLKQLDEPQKPILPKCAEQFLKIAQSSNDVIQLFDSIIYATDSDGLILEKWGWSVDFYNWLAKDSDTLYILCDALRYGYEVEKEPLYYIKLVVPTSTVVGLYLGFNREGGFDHSYGKPHDTWGWKCTFTETEIKAMDERYWAFAVPVEEVEG
ncbi:DUF1642 domain-containing protein [Enterococcus thailandicus]|uniref:DUF1642 domain-containing protein n=1 Tax=Enterococcus thailandicus TaxID=417368 RepID=UPI002542902A|nr:DUF1642 domain-containing protein [Enterococcus thailandicus]MDK4351195.1 DUF1642 domain-containing protein [Enterococcus thailandicus]